MVDIQTVESNVGASECPQAKKSRNCGSIIIASRMGVSADRAMQNVYEINQNVANLATRSWENQARRSSPMRYITNHRAKGFCKGSIRTAGTDKSTFGHKRSVTGANSDGQFHRAIQRRQLLLDEWARYR